MSLTQPSAPARKSMAWAAGPGQPTGRGVADLSNGALGALMLFPAFALLGVIVVYPVCRLIWTSFFDLNLTTHAGARFVGWDNYGLLFTDPVFWRALLNTILITVITVPGALVVGMVLALGANLAFKRQWPVRLSLLIPWALPLAFTGLIFAWFFNSQDGVVNDVFGRLGLPRFIWFNSPALSMMTICLTIIWKTSSFMALILLAGLQSIPASLYEAAEVDGAAKVRQFFEITLPMLRPAIVAALIFRTITALQTFDIPYTMTRGGPGTTTVTLAMYIHQNTVDFLDLGYGSALAVVMFVLSMALTAIYLRNLRSPG